MREFQLRTLGHWSLERRGSAVHLASRKARALISFLAADREGYQSRAALSALLWPDAEVNKARASLRQCLAAIRKSVGYEEGGENALLSASGEYVALNKSVLTTDFDILLDEIESGDEPADLLFFCSEIPDVFSEIFDVSDPFSRWTVEFRANIESRLMDALKTIYLDHKMGPKIRFRCAQAAMSIDELEEDAVRTLMTLHVKNHNSTAALKIYGRLFERLEGEMDAEPSPATQDLAVSIKLAAASESSDLSLNPSITPKGTTKPPSVTLAVLPFEITGNEQNENYLSVGLMDHLTCHLASFKSPSVISSNTTRKYLGTTPRPAHVGHELSAKYVLSGTVRLDASDAFLTTQLVEAEGERVVWATTQHCAATEMRKLNLPIAEEIAQAIVPSVDAEELRSSQAMPIEDLEPYHLVLRAKDLVFRLDYGDFVRAGNLLRRAVEIGPQYSPAHAMLAEWYSLNLWEGWSDNPVADRVSLDQHVRKAIALSPRDGRAMALWAHNRMMFNREYDVALSLIREAIDFCPNDAETLAWSVPTLANTRQSEEAVQNGRKALALSPYDPFVFRNEHFLGLALYVNGDYDQASEFGLSCFRKAPNYRSNIRTTIVSLSAAGRKNEAQQLVEHHKSITPDFSVAKFRKISGLRSPADRDEYASHLLAAGLPD